MLLQLLRCVTGRFTAIDRYDYDAPCCDAPISTLTAWRFLHGTKLFSDQTFLNFPLGFRMIEFLTRSRKQCGGDGRRAWGDAFPHVVLCGSGFSRDLADDRSKEWMIGSRLVVSGLLFLSK